MAVEARQEPGDQLVMTWLSASSESGGDNFVQDIEWQGAVVENCGVEGANVETLPLALLGLGAHPLNLQTTDHVRRGLTWVADVPVDLSADR